MVKYLLHFDSFGNNFYTRLVDGRNMVIESRQGVSPEEFGKYSQNRLDEGETALLNVPGLAVRMIRESELQKIVEVNNGGNKS